MQYYDKKKLDNNGHIHVVERVIQIIISLSRRLKFVWEGIHNAIKKLIPSVHLSSFSPIILIVKTKYSNKIKLIL